MAFDSWKDYQSFEQHVKHQSRYVYSDQVKNFLQALRQTLCLKEINLKKGDKLYRSQIGLEISEWEGQVLLNAHPPKRMKPTSEYAIEGRANPKGIPYLYLSNDRDTSIAELRPHNNEMISCGVFEVNKNLTLIDCYSLERKYNNVEFIFNPPTEQSDIVNAIWSQIIDAFAKPVTNNETASDYVPTQILAELFKSQGYDGICCKSGLGEGHNFILFDLCSCIQVYSSILEVESISFKFKECSQMVKVKT